MAEVGASVRVVTASGIAPDEVVNLRLSPDKVPNPDYNSLRVTWDPATTGVPAVSYRGYRDGVHKNTTNASEPVLEAGFGQLTPLTDYEIKITSLAEDGTESDGVILMLTTIAAPGATPPPDPVGSVTIGSAQTDRVTATWTASPTVGVAYHVYVNGSASFTDVPPETTSLVITGLPAGTSVSVEVRAYDATTGLESTGVTATGATTADPTPDPDGSPYVLAPSDKFLDVIGINAKANYATGTYNRDVAANKTAVQDHMVGWGARVYRELASGNSAANLDQRDLMRVVYAANGTKYHPTIGIVKNANGYPISTYSAEQVRCYVADTVGDRLKMFIDLYKDDPTLGNGDLSNVIAEIGGPNEVDGAKADPNWARNTQLFQRGIYEAARNGKLWNAVWTKTKNASGQWIYNVTTPGTAYATRASGTYGDTRQWPTIFQNIKVISASGRADLNQQEATQLGGDLLTDGSGNRVFSQWCEGYNPHKYQIGKPVSVADLVTGIRAQRPMGAADWPDWSAFFTEGGYNHMGFQPDGSRTPEGGVDSGTVSIDGSRKCPPWVIATYYPCLFAEIFQMAGGDPDILRFYAFELLDDDDTPSAGARRYDIQAYFGQVWTPNNDPTSWVPLAQWYAMRRLTNLLKDRADPKVPDTHTPVRLNYTVTNKGGTGSNFQMVELHKRNGETYLLCWRRNFSIFDAMINGTANKVGTGDQVSATNPGTFVGGIPDPVNITIQLNHGAGTKNVARFRPNKAKWIHSGADGYGSYKARNLLSASEIEDCRSTGHDDATTWAGANPTPDETLNTALASGGSFTFRLGHNLEIIRIK